MLIELCVALYRQVEVWIDDTGEIFSGTKKNWWREYGDWKRHWWSYRRIIAYDAEKDHVFMTSTRRSQRDMRWYWRVDINKPGKYQIFTHEEFIKAYGPQPAHGSAQRRTMSQ